MIREMNYNGLNEPDEHNEWVFDKSGCVHYQKSNEQDQPLNLNLPNVNQIFGDNIGNHEVIGNNVCKSLGTNIAQHDHCTTDILDHANTEIENVKQKINQLDEIDKIGKIDKIDKIGDLTNNFDNFSHANLDNHRNGLNDPDRLHNHNNLGDPTHPSYEHDIQKFMTNKKNMVNKNIDHLKESNYGKMPNLEPEHADNIDEFESVSPFLNSNNINKSTKNFHLARIRSKYVQPKSIGNFMSHTDKQFKIPNPMDNSVNRDRQCVSKSITSRRVPKINSKSINLSKHNRSYRSSMSGIGNRSSRITPIPNLFDQPNIANTTDNRIPKRRFTRTKNIRSN